MLYAGQVFHYEFTITDQDAPPSGAALTITKPDGTIVSPAPVLTGPVQSGRDYTFSFDYAFTSPGRYQFAASTSSPGTALLPYVANVRAYAPLIGLDEIKDHLNITGTGSDDELSAFLVVATEIVESRVGSCAVRTITGEYLPGTTRTVIRLPSGPVPAADSVTSIVSTYADGPSWQTADLIVNPGAGTVRSANGWRFWGGPWLATYTAGRTVIPERFMQACKEQVRHMWDTQRGAAPPSVLQGEEIYSPTGGASAYTVPRRVLELLERDMGPVMA